MPEMTHSSHSALVPVKSVTSPVLQRACDCSAAHVGAGPCATCPSEEKLGSPGQLTIGPTNDAFEQEAEQIATQVVSGTASPLQPRNMTGIQTQVQRKATSSAPQGHGASQAFVQQLSAAAQGGRPLAPRLRAELEPRFGRDLGHVFVHDGPAAQSLSHQINARAFTHRNDIFFGARQNQSDSAENRHLLAHEITHTLQQGGDTIRRVVSSKSTCPPNVHKAPAKPLDDLAVDDKRAAHLALGTANSLTLESILFQDPKMSIDSVSNAYKERFGSAPKKGKRWRSRFRKRTFKTENEAIAHEMEGLAARYTKISKWFDGNIRYRCPGTKSYTIPGCAPGPCGSNFAESCPGSRIMGICPAYWDFSNADSRAATLVHEAVHARLKYRGHSVASLNRRIRNPQCYEAVVSDVYGLGLTSFDCPKV
jgi:hypothetical protein